MRKTAGLAAVVVTVMAGAGVARADEASLYRGPGPRPGPDILYAGPAAAPQLTNAGVWQRRPDPRLGRDRLPRAASSSTRTSSTTTTARAAARDPGDPRTGDDTFSSANGTYTYPSDPVYADNAADLVELRVKPLADATAFRLTLNSMSDPERVAATIAIGSSAAPLPFPHGANATAPAAMFLTVHGASARPARRRHRSSRVAGGAPTVERRPRAPPDRGPRPARGLGPGPRRPCASPRASGSGTRAAGAYLAPQAGADATAARRRAAGPDRVLQRRLPLRRAAARGGRPGRHGGDPAWWRDRARAGRCGRATSPPFHADVDFGKLADGHRRRVRRARNRRARPHPRQPLRAQAGRRLHRRVLRRRRAAARASCSGACSRTRSTSRRRRPPAAATGCSCCCTRSAPTTTSSPAAATRRSSATAAAGTIVITPAGRGPDGWYYDLAGADTFEVWADVARHYALDPDVTSIAGYSMGGYGTYKFATQFPDLFARAQPTVGPPGSASGRRRTRRAGGDRRPSASSRRCATSRS